MGKAKLAPQAGHSIPRLELCGAVLATEIGQFVAKQLDILPSKMKYFTDSKVVLGYIRNKTRRFYTYVSNRISLIQQFTSCDQWNYVPSHLNPVDAATRDSSMDILSAINVWLKGPEYILRDNELLDEDSDDFPLIEPENDKEIRPVQVLKSTILTYKPVSERFTHHSSWNRLVNAFTVLRHIARSYRKERNSSCKGWHLCKESKSSEAFEETRIFLLKQTQEEYFKCETDNLKQGLPIKKDSSIISLSPYLDEQGILRVGGRLNRLRNKLGLASTNPIIVPKGHVATLLIRHFHEKTFHQGRKITEGEIRSNGFWIIGTKRLISTLIRTCVLCRKLRGKVEVQKMADLPEDRLTPGPPFSAVGVDTFGPWNVTIRRTRGGAAQSKRWAIIFTCLTIRAVHIELIEEMSSSSFINALRRITAIRGPIKIFRSDRGTNFIGATDQIGIKSINVENTKVKQHLDNTGSVWKFNSPHSSHMGGVWERMIGITRRILDGILLQQNKKALTHEVLSTLMAEVSAVINSRPITTISSDPESPIILSPNILLTQKQGEVPTISGEFSIKDIYTADWKHVQVLSDMFWNKWQENYLQELQSRQKWCIEKPNIKLGDIVFVKDKGLARNDWPVGVVEEAIKSDDNLVRKAVVRIYHEGKHVSYTRPITELVLLLEE